MSRDERISDAREAARPTKHSRRSRERIRRIRSCTTVTVPELAPETMVAFGLDGGMDSSHLTTQKTAKSALSTRRGIKVTPVPDGSAQAKGD